MKKTAIISLVIVLVIALVAMPGCSKSKKYKDADGNEYTVSGDGDSMTIHGEDGDSTYSVGDNLSWPKGSMGDLPELKGNIDAVSESPEGVLVSFSEVSQSDVEAYIGKLKGLGYETVMEMDLGEGDFMYFGQKGSDEVTLSFSSNDGKKGSCMITYQKS